MLRAAFETASGGHKVTVVTWCAPGRHRGVHFRKKKDFYALALDGGPWDAVVLWGDPDPFAPLSVCGGLGGALRICAMQCNGFTRPDAVQGYVDRYVSPSRTHARMLQERYAIPAEKFRVIPNGVEPSRFRLLGAPRNPFAVYHASSPDRGLHHLLELWPEIKAAEPRAELHVYYEIERFVQSVLDPRKQPHPVMRDLVMRLYVAMQRVTHGWGVTFHGSASQQAVADRACTSGVMCYPCDPVIFTEGFGTAVLESYVAGAVPVTTDADAFGEVYSSLFPLIPRAMVRDRLVAEVLSGIETAVRRVEAGKAGWAFDTVEEGHALAERYSWARIGQSWLTEAFGRELLEVAT